MDMEDDELIRSFMTARRADIADDGFTRKVMTAIPKERPLWMTAVTVVAAAALAAFLFVQLDVWSMLCRIVTNLVTLIAQARYVRINPLYYITFFALIVWLGTEKIREKA